MPSTVGGGGVHADGKLPRFREEDFALRATHGPIEGAAVADWPLGYGDLEPFYTEVERAIGVAGERTPTRSRRGALARTRCRPAQPCMRRP